MHYLLFYEFVPDYLERRAEFRAQHLKLAWEAQARGDLMLAGAYASPVDGAASRGLMLRRGTRQRWPFDGSRLVKKSPPRFDALQRSRCSG